jgi:hypothetical protein
MRELLEAAAAAVEGPRGAQYGPPRINLGERTARLFTAYLRDLGLTRDLDGRDVAALLILMKVARLQEGNGAQQDTWQDIAGYAATGWECSRVEGP